MYILLCNALVINWAQTILSLKHCCLLICFQPKGLQPSLWVVYILTFLYHFWAEKTARLLLTLIPFLLVQVACDVTVSASMRNKDGGTEV